MTPLRCAVVLAAGLAGCDATPEPPVDDVQEISWVSDEEKAEGPAHANWEMVEELRADQAAERHPSDGGGRAWLELDEDGGGDRAIAGRRGSFSILYEAGEHGISEDGVIGLQVSPFWGWSTPQVRAPQASGYTTVEHAGPGEPGGLTLDAETWGDQLLGITVKGRALEPGERIRIHYGAGAAGARADRFAEDAARLWITVDGDGDGVRGLLEDSPSVTMEPADAAGLVLALPGTLPVGASGRLTIAAVDGQGNAGPRVDGPVRLEVIPPGLGLPPRVELGTGARLTLPFTAEAEGLYKVRAIGPDGLLGQSNPLLVSDGVPRVLFGDVHGHTAFTDGTGSPEDYFAYARDVAGLDFAAITDHDHWGMRFLDAQPALWDRLCEAVRQHHRPERFVALHAYEWTSWIHGHRHVLFFDDRPQLYSSMDPRYEDPRDLWEALSGQRAITIAHHSGGGPIPTDWTVPPDPALEPVVEVASVHGVSEALDAPGAIYSAVPGNFVRDALDRGYTLGIIGSGDSHDGHPGLTHLASGQGGLVAVLDVEHTREGLHEAFRTRRTYATNGARTLLFTTVDGQPMGSVIEPSPRSTVVIFTVGDAPLEAVELVRSGAVIERLPGAGEPLLQVSLELEDLEAGEYLYVRVLQGNGGLAISSPFFVRGEPATMPRPAARTE